MRTIMRSAFLRAQYPAIATCVLTLSFALKSPFALTLFTAITPPAALFEKTKKVTTLSQRFIIF
jgi:hypothetical protein